MREYLLAFQQMALDNPVPFSILVGLAAAAWVLMTALALDPE